MPGWRDCSFAIMRPRYRDEPGGVGQGACRMADGMRKWRLRPQAALRRIPITGIHQAMMLMRRALPMMFLSMLLGGCALPLWSEPEIARNCRGDAYRQFDFWLGEWDVARSVAGAAEARSSIQRMLRGCAIQETYSTDSGYTGESINWYDPERSLWRQTWIDNTGLVLELSGGLDEQERMVLQGPARTTSEASQVEDRLTWQRREDGQIEQHWEQRAPGESDWRRVFTGYYRARPAAPTVGTPDSAR